MEYLKKKLKEIKVNYKLLWDKFIDQEILLKCAESRRKQLEKGGAKVIAQACKAAFFAGFERCKSFAQVHLPPDFIQQLRIDCLDEDLQAVLFDNLLRFTMTSYFLDEMDKTDAVVQIESIIVPRNTIIQTTTLAIPLKNDLCFPILLLFFFVCDPRFLLKVGIRIASI